SAAHGVRRVAHAVLEARPARGRCRCRRLPGLRRLPVCLGHQPAGGRRLDGLLMRCVVYRGTGGPEVVAVEERPGPSPAKFELLIATSFAGVNPADVLQREGRHPVPPGSPADVPGLEVAGTVVACGEAVSR